MNKHHAIQPNSIVGSCWVWWSNFAKMHARCCKYMTKSSFHTTPHTQATKTYSNLLFSQLTITLPPSSFGLPTYQPSCMAPLTYSHANLCLSLSLSLRGKGTYFASSQGFCVRASLGLGFLKFLLCCQVKHDPFPQPIELGWIIN